MEWDMGFGTPISYLLIIILKLSHGTSNGAAPMTSWTMAASTLVFFSGAPVPI